MGVMVPEVLIEKKANTNSVSSSSASQAAVELNNLMEDLIKLVEAESRLESIAHELMMTNRKVNSLERVMIPGLLELISYVEGRLEEESLEEFFRAKLVKKVIRGAKK